MADKLFHVHWQVGQRHNQHVCSADACSDCLWQYSCLLSAAGWGLYWQVHPSGSHHWPLPHWLAAAYVGCMLTHSARSFSSDSPYLLPWFYQVTVGEVSLRSACVCQTPHVLHHCCSDFIEWWQCKNSLGSALLAFMRMMLNAIPAWRRISVCSFFADLLHIQLHMEIHRN